MSFVDFNTLEQDTVYTVEQMQYLNGSAGAFYIIHITKPDNSVYYMNIRDGVIGSNIYEKLETIRTGIQKKRFSFTKTNVAISSDVSAPFIIVSGENGVVNLN